jgi:hypothetical protein
MSHSELIWERVKGALGVPPELDIDIEWEVMVKSRSQAARDQDDDDIDTSDMEDHGRKARGHWEDWDAIMDSPVFERSRRLTSEHAPVIAESPSNYMGGPFSASEGDAKPKSSSADSDATDASTPHPRSPKLPPSAGISIITQLPSPSSPPTQSDYGLSFEPLLSPSSSFTQNTPNPPPLSIPVSLSSDQHSLGDIAEGAEEEEDADKAKDATSPKDPPVESEARAPADEDDLVDPTQIHGLKFSTTPLATPIIGGSPYTTTPISNTNTYFPIGRPLSAASRSASSGSMHSFQEDQRRVSFGAGVSTSKSEKRLSGMSNASSDGGHPVEDWRKRYSGYESDGGSHGEHYKEGSEYGSESEGYGYNPVGDRAPGNPLFPSNFARLAVGPTLVAK